MADRGPIQTPFDDAVAETPSGAPAGGGKTGGIDVGEGTQYESDNSVSGLPKRVDLIDVGEGGNPPAQVPWPDIDSPGTFHPGKP